MAIGSWTQVVAYPDRMSAEAVAERLRAAAVPCYIASDEHLPGLGSYFSVRVPADFESRACRLIDPGGVSEEELVALAIAGAPSPAGSRD